MTVKSIIQEYINEAKNRGYRIATDLEGNIKVSDDKHGLISLRLTNIGDDVNFDLSHNEVASKEFIEDVTSIFISVLNR